MINKNFGELDAENVKKLFYDSNGTPSIQIGVQQDGSSAIKVSKPGIDVTTATANNLAFNSSQDVLKVITTGTTSFTPSFASHGANSSGTDQATTHVDLTSLGLTTPPAVLLYVQDNTYYRPVTDGTIYVTSLTLGASFSMYFKIGANTTDLSIGFWQSYGTGSTGAIGAFSTPFNFRYYILQESAL